ncbi:MULTISPECIES: sulfite exporter TauE/SafE family protein [Halobacteriovorax]|uniref:Probable membrane transporter protein n=1 Tax=Halobacteriovorax vibrionivorans TaxID=2152716 RepID=A0ABY0IF09_9BACT|nr:MULTISPECIES: sulfite exporter TauE/SafE family protein [Halobacteriovorax]AYF43946.1 sulfite exporter TauE/SafE [Halobacteriovorax sp. BALOs_7]RZF21524.1 sulfite exporter TauE/SafE family protein [Halobacteriovorax vibrionivorans]TGD49183.1 sulfite exporter TauE/SafE family protein [Halobacteriovorax sp. Y22]
MAYLLALIAGTTLGLLGGGGSILVVPILVYIVKVDPKIAITMSLAIVGLTGFMGTFRHYKNGNVLVKLAFQFGAMTMLSTYLGTYLAKFLTGQMQLFIFAGIMLLASISMLKNGKEVKIKNTSNLTIFLAASVVGIVTGLIGVGGGFLIVPALVNFFHVDMKKAVGTSLLIIAINSLIGFVGNIINSPGLELDYQFIAIFTALAIVGSQIGSALTHKLPQEKLKKIFGYFLIVMGAFMIIRETLL